MTGHQQTWEQFLKITPDDTCKRAHVTFDHNTQAYCVKSFGQHITVSLEKREVLGYGPVSDFLLNKAGHFFDLAVLWYLISAKDIPLKDEMIKPASIKGGQIFVTGTHVLPLIDIANVYATEPELFLNRGQELGGQVLDYGDASLKLYPFPKIPVTLILWQASEEFPAQVDLFFDVTCDQHLSTDVLWSTGMVTTLSMTQIL